jgi:hypothetical protein
VPPGRSCSWPGRQRTDSRFNRAGLWRRPNSQKMYERQWRGREVPFAVSSADCVRFVVVRCLLQHRSRQWRFKRNDCSPGRSKIGLEPRCVVRRAREMHSNLQTDDQFGHGSGRTTSNAMWNIGRSARRKSGHCAALGRKQDYQLHDDEIRKSFLAGLYPADDLMELMAKRYPSESAQQLRERIWTQYQSAILELFKKGDAEYDITSFDIDGDRVPETLSRISMIEPVMQGLSKYANGKIKWQVRTCMDNSKYAEFTLYLNGSATGSSNNYFQQLRTSFRLVGDEAIIFRYQAASYLMSQDFMVSSSERSGDEYVSEIHWTGLFEKRKTRFLGHSVVTWGQGDSP